MLGSFDIADISFELFVNDELRQGGHVRHMIFSVPQQVTAFQIYMLGHVVRLAGLE